MIGQNVTIEELEKTTTVIVKEGKKEKKINWWNYYMFDDEVQYSQWRTWAKVEIAKLPEVEEERQLLENLNFVDLVYGLKYKIKGGH